MSEPSASKNDNPWEQSQNRDRRRNRLVGFLFLAAAVICFELTANPALSVALGCLKFGWHDAYLGHRLKRADPNRARGRVCAWFYLALGLWKISIVATFLMFGSAMLFGAIEGPNKRPNPANPDPGFVAFMTACALAMLGFGLSALVSSFAVLSALRYRIRVWVGVRKNHARLMLLTALMTDSMVIALFAVIFFGDKVAGLAISPAILTGLLLGAMIVAGVLILVTLGALERVIARTPEECWPVPLDLSLNPHAGNTDNWFEADRVARDRSFDNQRHWS